MASPQGLDFTHWPGSGEGNSFELTGDTAKLTPHDRAFPSVARAALIVGAVVVLCR